MSLFNTLTSLAASTLTTVLIENHRRPAPASHPTSDIDPSHRVVELTPSPPARQRRREIPLPQAAMQSSGLPQNSIWTTMSYPIPRGPCLQKSSLISACSCQRFMVHPLKATSSFDCDGCGHHASFHRMKSHEEEVENAAKFRESLANAQRSSMNSSNGNGGRMLSAGSSTRLIQGGSVEEIGEEEDDDTLDGEDEYTEPDKKRRAAANRAGSEASEGTSRRTKKSAVASTTRAGKRKRVGEHIVLE
ncbi:hypothetical protein ABW20_dc0107871 [Dactylellina cionopaga]|nr:hypothetical protein ABW20_dc0107871 [Dactylellina cionopaga]